MGAASHLGINLREYDARIRTFIPRYETMLDEAASMMRLVGRAPLVVDLGIGTGALSARVLAAAPRARIIGVDSDDAMLAVAHRRLGSRLVAVHGNFERVLGRSAKAFALPSSFALPDGRAIDAMTASFALHHVRTRRRKASLYRRAHRALRRGGLLVSADCYPASDPRLRASDREAWLAHLQQSYSRKESIGFFRAWARDDVHFTLDEELAMLRAAGFRTDVPWRTESFAVVLALKR
jgi:SAM-dependent methyltransferase